MSYPWFLGILSTLAVGHAALCEFRAPNEEKYLIGDCPYYAATTESLLFDGDFDLANQLVGDQPPERWHEALARHDSFFALSPDDRIVPKHSTLMPIAAIPFRAAFGRIGFLVFNVLQSVVLVCGIATLGGSTSSARLTALAGYVASPLFAYTFNFSPDVFGTALVVWAYVCAARGRWVSFGLLAGLAVWAKVYLLVILLPGAGLAVWAGWRAIGLSLVSGTVALIPMFAINIALYGGPLATGYDREARVGTDGRITVLDHYSRFHQPWDEGLRNLLFDERIGLVRTAPLWALWPAGAWVLARRAGGWPLTLASAVALNFLIFARYDEWYASVMGNRFLFPALAIGTSFLGPLIEALLKRRATPEE